MQSVTYVKTMTVSAANIGQVSTDEQLNVHSMTDHLTELCEGQGGIRLRTNDIETSLMLQYIEMGKALIGGRLGGTPDQNIEWLAEHFQMYHRFLDDMQTSAEDNHHLLYAHLVPIAGSEARVTEAMQALGYALFQTDPRYKGVLFNSSLSAVDFFKGELGYQRIRDILVPNMN